MALSTGKQPPTIMVTKHLHTGLRVWIVRWLEAQFGYT